MLATRSDCDDGPVSRHRCPLADRRRFSVISILGPGDTKIINNKKIIIMMTSLRGVQAAWREPREDEVGARTERADRWCGCDPVNGLRDPL